MTLATLHLHVDAKFTSPYAMSVFVSLHEKGLSFDISTVDLAKLENQQAAFAASSLTQRVPLLIHDGFALSESSAITEYLDEVFPEPALYPADIRQISGSVRGLARFKPGYVATSCRSDWNVRLHGCSTRLQNRRRYPRRPKPARAN